MNTFAKMIGAVCALGLASLSTSAIADGHSSSSKTYKPYKTHMPYKTHSSPTWFVSYGGVDFADSSTYYYKGMLISLNQDLSQDGFVLRTFGSFVSYEYDNPSVTGGIVDGDGDQYDAMIGYLFIRDHGSAGIYVGVDYQDHDLTPDDPSNPVRGSEVGFKVAGDIRYWGPQMYLTIEGQYSTAFDSYWGRGRIGANLEHFVIGPEVAAFGNESFDATRVGGFLAKKIALSSSTNIELTLSGGYQFVEGDDHSGSRGGDGGYGAVNVSAAF